MSFRLLKKYEKEIFTGVIAGIIATLVSGILLTLVVNSGYLAPKTDIDIFVSVDANELSLVISNNDYYAGKDFRMYLDWLDLGARMESAYSPEAILCDMKSVELGHGFSVNCDYIPPKSQMIFKTNISPAFPVIQRDGFVVTYWSENTPIKKLRCPLHSGECSVLENYYSTIWSNRETNIKVYIK